MIDYNTGPAFCDTGGSWEIYKEGSTSTALFAQRYLTCIDKSSIKPYAIVSCGGICTSDPDISIRNATDVVGCADGSVFSPTYFISGTLKVTWKRAGKYKVKYKPANPSCPLQERYVTVVDPNAAISIGSLSGNPYPLCSFDGSITYSVPDIPGVTQYEWRLATSSTSPASINMSFNGATSTSTTQPSVTVRVTPSNGYATGSLTVTARTPCGGSSTRSFTVTRTTPQGGIKGPASLCVGSYYNYTTAPGTNHVWSVSSTAFNVNAASNTATVQATRTGSALLRVTYNRLCDNVLVTESLSISTTSTGCGPGGWEPMLVAPNPAVDVAEISYPDKSGEYDVRVYNAYNEVVAGGKLRKGKLRLNVRALPEGVYYVLLTDGKDVRVSTRLLKK
jgi:hypothetical protein